MNQTEGQLAISAALEPGEKLLWSGIANFRRYWSVPKNQVTGVAVLVVGGVAVFWMRDRYLSLFVNILIVLFVGIATYVRTNAFGLSETGAIKFTRAAPFFTNQIRRIRLVTNSGHPVPIKLHGTAAVSFGGRFAEADRGPDGTRRVEKITFECLEDAEAVYKIAVEAQQRLLAAANQKSA